MKNKILLTLAIFVLMNCEIKVQETNAQTNQYTANYENDKRIIDGIEYMLFYVKDKTSQTGYAISVVNLTKDKLEIEWLKKQLSDTVINKKRK